MMIKKTKVRRVWETIPPPKRAPKKIARSHAAKIIPIQSSLPKNITRNSRIKSTWVAIE